MAQQDILIVMQADLERALRVCKINCVNFLCNKIK